jgi:hypothetical protein
MISGFGTPYSRAVVCVLLTRYNTREVGTKPKITWSARLTELSVNAVQRSEHTVSST